MGWIIATIILTIITTILGFALFNLLKKNETLEDFISKQSDAVNECDRRLKEIDKRNIFYFLIKKRGINPSLFDQFQIRI